MCLVVLASLWLLLLLPQSGLVGHGDLVALLDLHLEPSRETTHFATSGSPAAAEDASSVATAVAESGFAIIAA